MAYNDFKNCTLEEYNDVIYSQDTQNELKISFGGVELQDADLYCEKMTLTSRITTSSKNAFSLNNFIAKEMTIIFHNVEQELIQDPVVIDLGTIVKGQMEYVRIGTFYIQDTPTTDKGKTTIKLRDGAVKFDFGYNAKPLMDENEGKATLKQILDDICLQAGINHNIESFPNQDLETGFYDNTIKARAYISYIAEQCGCIAIINRFDELEFISLNNLHVWNIPLDIVEKYTIDEPYKIERVVYESGTIKYETSSDEDLDTLYLDGSNPYITNETQINYIFSSLSNFEIDSMTTGKILGNPALDPYDFIKIVDTEDNNKIILESLANNVLTYSGVFTNTFDTQIGIEKRKENTTIGGEATFKKWAKTEIDNVNATITQTVSIVNDMEGRIEQVEVKQTATDLNIDIITTVDEDGNITGVKTSTGYTFDKNGLNIFKDNESFNSLHDNTGTYYKDGDTIVSQTTKDGTVTKDFVMYGTYYYGVEDELDVENFKKDDAMFIAQLFNDENGEECVGHFYNR